VQSLVAHEKWALAVVLRRPNPGKYLDRPFGHHFIEESVVGEGESFSEMKMTVSKKKAQITSSSRRNCSSFAMVWFALAPAFSITTGAPYLISEGGSSHLIFC
jgi:hypothetical protein